jgi:hypothetical protein
MLMAEDPEVPAQSCTRAAVRGHDKNQTLLMPDVITFLSCKRHAVHGADREADLGTVPI